MSSRHALSRKLRRPNEKKSTEGLVSRAPESMIAFPQRAKDQRLTFAGVCCLLWEELQIWRRWEPKTAENYGRIMGKKVLLHCDSRAFEDLDEDDYMELWNKLLRQSLSASDLKGASVVIRGIVELAYERGLTQTILWGLPMNLVPEWQKSDPMKSEEQHKEELRIQATERMRTPKSVALETELAMTRAMIENSWEHGELMAGLIMLCTGARTSEATGFSYKHLCEVDSDYWALVRYDVSEKDSRQTRGGGKTSNAFRLLPVPKFLAALLLKRRRNIARKFPERTEEELGSFPLACKGTDIQTRCTQKELNQVLKRIYQEAGVPEDLMAYAYLDMQKEPTLKEECEGKATAYLLRRMFATAAVYCGLTEGEICAVMGHAIEDKGVKKADFSNPDQFRKLADKIFIRPMIQVFDGRAGEQSRIYSGEPLQFFGENDIVIAVPKEQEIHVSAMNLLSGDPVQITASGIAWNHKGSFVQPETAECKNLVMTRYLWELGQRAWEGVRDQRIHLQQCRSEPVAKWGRAPDGTPDTMTVVPTAERRSYADLKGELLQQEPEYEEFWPSAQQEEGTEQDEQMDRHLERKTVSWAADEKLHILTDQGRLLVPADPFLLQKTRLVGNRLPELGKREKVMGVIAYDPIEEGWILSPGGVLYRVPRGTGLNGNDFCSSEHPAYRALLDGGVFLQSRQDECGRQSIVCLADTGRIRRVLTTHLKRIPDTGRQLVHLSDGETLVAACMCGEKRDLLIVSRAGRVLHIESQHLRALSVVGGFLCEGMGLRSGDRVAACIPYQHGDDILILTQSGKAVRLRDDYEIVPHGRGSLGATMVRLDEGDRVLTVMHVSGSALLLLSKEGRSLCVNLKEIPAVRSAAKGVQTMRLNPGQSIAAAAMLQITEGSRREA